MNRIDDGVRRRREKPIDLMRARDRFRFRPAVAFELGPDAGEAGQRPIVVDREPDDILFLGPGVRFRRSAKLLNGTRQRFSGFSQPRQCGEYNRFVKLSRPTSLCLGLLNQLRDLKYKIVSRPSR
jgi:hypothetical protein